MYLGLIFNKMGNFYCFTSITAGMFLMKMCAREEFYVGSIALIHVELPAS